jgi:hypothetical protein
MSILLGTLLTLVAGGLGGWVVSEISERLNRRKPQPATAEGRHIRRPGRGALTTIGAAAAGLTWAIYLAVALG